MSYSRDALAHGKSFGWHHRCLVVVDPITRHKPRKLHFKSDQALCGGTRDKDKRSGGDFEWEELLLEREDHGPKSPTVSETGKPLDLRPDILKVKRSSVVNGRAGNKVFRGN